MTSAHTADPYHLVVGERIGLEVYHRLVTEVVRSLPSSPQAILDVGAGTGRATFELAGVCPHARVVALDSHRQALARVEARALELGLTRVVPVEGDMDVTLPDLQGVDVVWASASLHHSEDPVGVLRRVWDVLAPGGHVVIVEHDGFPAVVPQKVAFLAPGLSERVQELMSTRGWNDWPQWSPLLEDAGFDVVSRREFVGVSAAGVHDDTAFARHALELVLRHADGQLTASQEHVVSALTNEQHPLYLDEGDVDPLHVGFVVWVARRP